MATSGGVARGDTDPRTYSSLSFNENDLLIDNGWLLCGDDDDSNDMTRMKAEITCLRQRIQSREKRLEEMQHLASVWDDIVHRAERDSANLDSEVQYRQLALEAILGRKHAVGPPGPAWLEFVEGNMFGRLACSVIIANMVTMALEASHSEYEQMLVFVLLNGAFLVFYIVELSLKALLFQWQLLFGPWATVCWNWVDVVVVCFGVIDQCIVHFFQTMDESTSHIGILRVGRLMRFLRLTRPLKLIKVILDADFSWTEEDPFQKFLLFVIVANSIIIGLECDFADFAGWEYVEHALLIVFGFELMARIRLHGMLLFRPARLMWTWLDVVIVGGGVVDLWLLPCVTLLIRLLGAGNEGIDSVVDKLSTVVRLARLSRIFRLLRLVQAVPSLRGLISGIFTAMRGMFWVLILLLVCLYVCAVLIMHVAQEGVVIDGVVTSADIQAVVPDVQSAIFLLFNVMNGDSSQIGYLLENSPSLRILCMAFYILTAWCILAILTGVVSENMLTGTEMVKKQQEALAKDQAAEQSRLKLGEVFDMSDGNENCSLNQKEFDNMLNNPVAMTSLTEVTGLCQNEFRTLFKYISNRDPVTDEYSIEKEAFINGLECENRPVSERSIMRLESRLAEIERFLRTTAGTLFDDRSQSFRRQGSSECTHRSGRLNTFNTYTTQNSSEDDTSPAEAWHLRKENDVGLEQVTGEEDENGLIAI
eukprot:TRINITY_DN61468_c0_g1_i1.p1 TRINITY_DN61468_c0_g1~~TRINITY_DN61468_c0_g1_i1.p1  ORF type:complete len:705 (-),score=111.20 TRINITY_DN61468_c0_g1_i1:409-2523(-)